MMFPEANADEAINGIYSEIAEVFGKVPIAYQALALRSDMFEQLWRLAKRLLDSIVIELTKLMIALDVAIIDSCISCMGGYRTMLKDVGQTEAVIESIEQRMASNDFSDKAQSALVYSYAITIDPHGIDKNSLVAFRRTHRSGNGRDCLHYQPIPIYNRDDSRAFVPSLGVE